MQHRGPLGNALLLCLAASLPLGAPRPAQPAQFQMESDTLVRHFERDTRRGSDQTVLPVYEYLRLAAGELEDKGISIHVYGRGRDDLAGHEAFAGRSQGQLLHGSLQHTRPEANFAARLGRMHAFEGVANEAVDGRNLWGDLSSAFTVSVYGDQPVALEIVDGRSGDRVWGGRLSHHWGYRSTGVACRDCHLEGPPFAGHPEAYLVSHGDEAVSLGTPDACAACHGSDLAGGALRASCFQCHTRGDPFVSANRRVCRATARRRRTPPGPPRPGPIAPAPTVPTRASWPVPAACVATGPQREPPTTGAGRSPPTWPSPDPSSRARGGRTTSIPRRARARVPT